MLTDNAKFVARAFMAPPDAEQVFMALGATAHEGALMLAIHCAATIAKTMESKRLAAEAGITSWSECVKTLDAALALVKQAEMPTAEGGPHTGL